MKTTLTIASDKVALFEEIPGIVFTKMGETDEHTIYDVEHYDAAQMFYYGQFLGLESGRKIWNDVQKEMKQLNF